MIQSTLIDTVYANWYSLR